MPENLRNAIQETFAEALTLDEVARIYYDIRTECEKQLEYMLMRIAKELHDDGMLDEGCDNE